jgi:hypothetical protein
MLLLYCRTTNVKQITYRNSNYKYCSFYFSDEDDEAEIENYYRNKYAETQVSERFREAYEETEEISQQSLLPGVKYVMII